MANLGAALPQGNSISIGLDNLTVPPEGARMLPYSFTLANGNSGQISLTQSFQKGDVSIIQGVYIDNADNANIFYLTVLETNQRIAVPSNSQGYAPILIAKGAATLQWSTAGSTAIVNVDFLNFPVPVGFWKSV